MLLDSAQQLFMAAVVAQCHSQTGWDLEYTACNNCTACVLAPYSSQDSTLLLMTINLQSQAYQQRSREQGAHQAHLLKQVADDHKVKVIASCKEYGLSTIVRALKHLEFQKAVHAGGCHDMYAGMQ
jgi:hypothetical protein